MASVDTPDDQIIAVNYGDIETDDWAGKHQINLSEVATRLNAKQHYDNRGRQIWTDGAEEPVIQWHVNTVAPSTIARVNTCAWRGSWSVLQRHPGPGISGAYLFKRFYYPGSRRIGVEVAFSLSSPLFTYVRIELNVYTGTRWQNYYVRVNGNTGIVEYLEDIVGWIALPGAVAVMSDIHYWHKIKMVIDIDLLEYCRILYDSFEHDLTGTPAQDFVNPLGPYISVSLYSEGNGAAVYDIYLDDFILTHLEP